MPVPPSSLQVGTLYKIKELGGQQRETTGRFQQRWDNGMVVFEDVANTNLGDPVDDPNARMFDPAEFQFLDSNEHSSTGPGTRRGGGRRKRRKSRKTRKSRKLN